MYRFAQQHLLEWIKDPNKKPLVIRGARQVGKTWLVRSLAKESGRELFELNFEKHPNYVSLFEDNDPHKVLQILSSYFKRDIHPDNSLLFLDEIQIAPYLLAKLRWFAEEMPELPVIATGSLLDFALSHHTFSMPVGRISYFFLEPLSFEEFLIAKGEDKLVEYLRVYELNDEIPNVIHEKAKNLFREYIFVGGLPAAVQQWITSESPISVSKIHHDLLHTYRDDFAKYAGRVSIDRLEEILMAIPKLLGNKFKFSNVNSEVQAFPLKQSLSLLSKARVCHKVDHSFVNGLPLGGGGKKNFFKVVLLDTGLATALLELQYEQLKTFSDLQLFDEGGLCEQVVGQLLRVIRPYFIDPKLYYWAREKSGSQAEVDYVIQHQTTLVPIEVKSGSTGKLRSLHYLMAEKQLPKAVRINGDYPSKVIVDTAIAGKQAKYLLLSLPFYMLEQLSRLLDSL